MYSETVLFKKSCVSLLNPVLDAWGKIPSAFLEGNSYSFGGFSECFHIERDDELYNTKYCMGQLEFVTNVTSSPMSYRHTLNEAIYPLLVESDVEPRDLTPK